MGSKTAGSGGMPQGDVPAFDLPPPSPQYQPGYMMPYQQPGMAQRMTPPTMPGMAQGMTQEDFLRLLYQSQQTPPAKDLNNYLSQMDPQVQDALRIALAQSMGRGNQGY
jgi:hypothetical protein